MGDDWKASVEAALKSLSDAIKDAAQLDVSTYACDVGKPETGLNKERLIARTEFLLDGDANHYVPVKTVDSNMVLAADLLAQHESSVEKAVKARMEMIESAKGLLAELKGLLD